MEYAYLTLLSIDGKYYIQLTGDDKEKSLFACKSVEEVVDTFGGFRKSAMSSSYESHISGSMGIINIRPHAIKVPIDNPDSLSKYIINMHPLKVKGSVFGGFVNFDAVEVTKDILELSACDIAHKIIEEVYS